MNEPIPKRDSTDRCVHWVPGHRPQSLGHKPGALKRETFAEPVIKPAPEND
jgi:hypothetical protein